MTAPAALGRRRRRGGVAWSPARLFAASEPGAWYDPSDLTTLFQDAAGTTPVTAVEQPVGLMLDKSKGALANLGSELVTNGDFSNGTTGWTASAPCTLAVVSGRLALTPGDAFGRGAYQLVTLTAGRMYRLSFDYDRGTATNPIFYFAGTTLGGGETIPLSSVSNSGTLVRYFVATGTSTYFNFQSNNNNAGNTFYIDNVSVREVPGVHATASGTARPTLRARYNLLTYSDTLATNWTGYNASVTTNAAVAPDGTTTASRIVEASGSAQQARYGTITNSLTAATTFAIYAKAAERSFINLSMSGSGSANWFAATFDLTNGTVSQTGAGASGTYTSSSITAVGNGWYLCVVTGNVNQNSSWYAYVGPATTGTPTYGTFGVLAYSGNTANGVLAWRADARYAADWTAAPTPQRIAAATDYDTTGFLPYLAASGAQAMSTPANVNLSSTDKVTVLAGVTKLSDAAISAVVETNSTATPGFGVYAPRGAPTPSYSFISGGSSFVVADTSTTISAPTTGVLAGSGNIAGPSAVLRVNGAQAASNTSTQGTGNYGSYPLYLFARNAASLFLTGRLYALIVRGAATDAGTLTQAEAWVNTKTRAY